MNKLNEIVKLLPLGAVILIGLGVLKTTIYYNYFGVDIMSYLSIDEVVTLFLNENQTIIILFFIGAFHFFFSEILIDKLANSGAFEMVLRKYKWGYFRFFLVLSLLLILVFYFDIFLISTFLVYLFIFALVNLVTIPFINKDPNKPIIEKRGFLSFLITICCVIIIPLISLRDIRKIEKNKGPIISLYWNGE